MGRKYVSYSEIEDYIGRDKMISFFEVMRDRFESSCYEQKEKKIKIEFVSYTLYLKYDERFAENKDVPTTYDYLYELCDILGDDFFEKFSDKFRGKRLSVSYTHVRNALVNNAIQNGKRPRDVAEKYGITLSNAYKIKKRYTN